MNFKKTMDRAIRMCDNKFKPGDLVRYYNSIFMIITSNEDKGTYSIVDVFGGGSTLLSQRIDNEGKKISKIPKGIFTDQWGSKWEITEKNGENGSAKSLKSGEKKTFTNSWLRTGGRVEWQ